MNTYKSYHFRNATDALANNSEDVIEMTIPAGSQKRIKNIIHCQISIKPTIFLFPQSAWGHQLPLTELYHRKKGL